MIEFTDRSTVRLHKTNASDVDVAYAAWVSNFGNEAEERDTTDVTKLIEFLYRERHLSPFEHSSFTWFVDTPIFVAREFMRHRTFSYNETSGRYKQLDGRFYIPDDKRPLVQNGRVGAYRFSLAPTIMNMAKRRFMEKGYKMSWRMYRVMLRVGIAKEVSRMVLPVGIMTQFYATANPRNVMQFLMLRNDPNAQWEIREVAKQIEKDFAAAMPLTYAAYMKYDYRNDKAEISRLEALVKQLSNELANAAMDNRRN